MRDTVKLSLLVIAGLLLASVSLSAHHGNAGYDTRTVTVKGVVTQSGETRSGLATCSGMLRRV